MDAAACCRACTETGGQGRGPSLLVRAERDAGHMHLIPSSCQRAQHEARGTPHATTHVQNGETTLGTLATLVRRHMVLVCIISVYHADMRHRNSVAHHLSSVQ